MYMSNLKTIPEAKYLDTRAGVREMTLSSNSLCTQNVNIPSSYKKYNNTL